MDREGFRERFKAYKNGKPISEIYDAGLPKYEDGNDLSIDQIMPYILAIENPTKLGLENGIWKPPTDSTKWDIHAIGGGLDIREKNNPIVYNYLKSKNRLNNPYLTVGEEEMLRRQTFEKTTLPALRKMHGKYGDKISKKGYARIAGMKWQGHPYLMAITPDSITGKAFINAIASGDKDLDSVFDAYYKYPANAKRYGTRINADAAYWKNYTSSLKPSVKSKLVLLLEQQDKNLFQPWSNYHLPDYSLNNPAPATISSWNNLNSPAQTKSEYSSRRAYERILNLGLKLLSEYDSFWPQLQVQEPGLNITPVNFVTESGFKPIVFDPNQYIGYKDGKSSIYIKPSKRGSFTAAAKKHGASVAEFERRVLKNPEKYSKAMRKKAQFSHNARSWKH